MEDERENIKKSTGSSVPRGENCADYFHRNEMSVAAQHDTYFFFSQTLSSPYSLLRVPESGPMSR